MSIASRSYGEYSVVRDEGFCAQAGATSIRQAIAKKDPTHAWRRNMRRASYGIESIEYMGISVPRFRLRRRP
jgi:hypothetical protein